MIVFPIAVLKSEWLDFFRIRDVLIAYILWWNEKVRSLRCLAESFQMDTL